MLLHNWMKNIRDEKSLKDINIPGTHDSATKFCTYSLFSSCQNSSISEQLNMGARAFDIRVEGMNLVHSFCKCKKSFFGEKLTLFDVVGDMFSFLSKNPSETILMLFKMDGGNDSAECLDLLFENFIKTNPDKWYLENKIPKLGEVRGKIVLIRRTDTNFEKAGIDFTSMPDHGSKKETDAGDFSPNGTDIVTVQDRYNLLRRKKWKSAVKPVLDNEEMYKDNFILNYFSTAGIPVIPRFNAKHINKKFLEFPLKKDGHYGTLMFDFLAASIAEKVILSNKTL